MTEPHVIYVFIDASNVWEAQKAKGKMFDFVKIISCIQTKFAGTAIKVFYYTAYPAAGTRDYDTDGKHRFYTFLKKKLGVVVRKKPLKRIHLTNSGGTHGDSIQEKGNMDVEMTIDVMRALKQYDTAVFFTGDSDFLALVTYLRNEGKKVYIFSSKNNVSQELRTGSDGYFDVLQMPEDIWGRDLQHRPK
jgi:uncharacterized LabA/DUF88 family protein